MVVIQDKEVEKQSCVGNHKNDMKGVESLQALGFSGSRAESLITTCGTVSRVGCSCGCWSGPNLPFPEAGISLATMSGPDDGDVTSCSEPHTAALAPEPRPRCDFDNVSLHIICVAEQFVHLALSFLVLQFGSFRWTSTFLSSCRNTRLKAAACLRQAKVHGLHFSGYVVVANAMLFATLLIPISSRLLRSTAISPL